MNHLSLKFDSRQHQTLTPRLQYAVRLLQLSSLDYEQELHDVMGKNPFLEIDDTPVARSAALESIGIAAVDNAAPDMPTPTESHDDVSELHGATDAHEAPDSDHHGADEHDSWVQSPGSMRDGARESQTSAMDMMVADTNLRQHLRSQANMLPLSARDHALVCTVIESLDDDGYLRLEPADLVAMTGLEPAVDTSEMNIAVRLVQSFDPPGVGARGVAECLLLQLEKIEPGLRDLARRVVNDHLERLAQRDVAQIARALGETEAAVDAACAALRRLDPRPGWRFSRTDTHFVTPDVIARKVRGKWVAQLNPAVVPRLRLNRTYAELFQRHRDGKHAEMGAHLQEARWAVRNVEQRFSTILAVSQAILRRQYPFFEFGPLAMKPMALRDIAEEVGVHESTVCRVTNNKYMATPGGLFELKHFFSRAMPMAGGVACSATAIRGVVKELIDAEDPTEPLSDVDIARKLARQGLTVARRTVTKYRQMLRVPPADRRRLHRAALMGGGQQTAEPLAA